MPKVTWLGDNSDSEECEGFGHKFKKGEAVEVNLGRELLRTIAANRFFKVEGFKDEPEGDESPKLEPEQSSQRDDDEGKSKVVSASGQAEGKGNWPKI